MNSLIDGSLGAEVGLEGDSLHVLVLESLKCLLGLSLAGRRVVVNRDIGAALGEVGGDEGSEVLLVSGGPSANNCEGSATTVSGFGPDRGAKTRKSFQDSVIYKHGGLGKHKERHHWNRLAPTRNMEQRCGSKTTRVPDTHFTSTGDNGILALQVLLLLAHSCLLPDELECRDH